MRSTAAYILPHKTDLALTHFLDKLVESGLL